VKGRRAVPTEVRRRGELLDRLRLAAPGLLAGRSTAVNRDFGAVSRVADRRSDRPSLSLLALVVATVETFAAGNGTTCRHEPRLGTAVELFAATWKPGTVVCGECVHVLLIRPDSLEARRCAACGRVAGPDEVVYAGATRFGRLLFRSLVCSGCVPRGR
jgi:hypothetical protein